MATASRNPLNVITASQLNGRQSTSGAARRMSTKPPPPQADRRLTFAAKPKEQNRNSIGRRQTIVPKPNTGTAVANRPSIGMRRQSTVFGEVGGKPDPRNIKDKATIHRYIQELIRYLTTNGFDQSISPKVLTAPSSKDFFYIFKFLVNQIDNHFDYSAKPDEDVCMIFKLLRYPFGMSKRSLLSVGTPHTWPALLSALAWFVELLNYNQVVLTLEEEEPDDKLFFRFCYRAYELFLAGANEFPVLEEELASNFADKNKQLAEDTDMLKKRHQDNLNEIERLKTGPHRLKTVLEKKIMFERDIEKFKSLIGQLEVRQGSLDKKLLDITKAVSTAEQELEAAQREKVQLEQALAQQELNKVDAEKINKERSQLEDGLRMVHAQQEELKKAIWSKELELSRVYEDASTSVKEYNSRATDIGLIPSTSKRAHGISYEIKFEPHDGEHMLSKDVKRDIKPHFESLLSTLRGKLETRQFQEMDLQDKLTTLQETYQDKCNSNKRLQTELKNTELLYSGQRESLESQSRLKESQISNLKDETRTVKQQAQHELVQSTALLDTTQKQLDITRQQVFQEREDIKTNITMMVEMLANHKQHVEDRLKELQQFYSEQYNALQM